MQMYKEYAKEGEKPHGSPFRNGDCDGLKTAHAAGRRKVIALSPFMLVCENGIAIKQHCASLQ